MSRRASSIALLLVFGFLASPPATAATADAGRLAISPAYQPVEVSGTDPVRHVSVEIGNFTSVDETFKLSTTDFTAHGEDGGIAFLGQSASSLSDRYGLAVWMSLDSQMVTVPAGGSVRVGVTITNQEGMAPGGHYGAILAAAQDTPGEAGSAPQVGVKQVLSSLILVTKQGGGQPDLKLLSQVPNGSGWQLPASFEQRFQNAGNVHVTPRGVTRVTDPAGRMVERGALNDGSGIILPASYRRYGTQLVRLAAAWLPGRYTATTTYRYDGIQSTKTLVTHFWYVGMVGVWAGLLAGLAALGTGSWWAWRRRASWWRKLRRR